MGREGEERGGKEEVEEGDVLPTLKFLPPLLPWYKTPVGLGRQSTTLLSQKR